MNQLDVLKEEMVQTIRGINAKGWSPATSTNYSFRESAKSDVLFISKSGIDKEKFELTDFMTTDRKGKPTDEFKGVKSSAETEIHTTIYDMFPETTVILHSHSIYPIVITQHCGDNVLFEGFELQKGFEGVTSHMEPVEIPIFGNTQDIAGFSKMLTKHKKELLYHCFIMRKHGIYAWGKNIFEAKRHLETLDYLCHVKYLMRH
jgi:methylthioribulose-1-phosphate dehydratase